MQSSAFSAFCGTGVGRRRERHESDASVHSLPADVQQVITVAEGDLRVTAISKTSRESASAAGGRNRTCSSGSEEAFLGDSASTSKLAGLEFTYSGLSSAGSAIRAVGEAVGAGSEISETRYDSRYRKSGDVEASNLQPPCGLQHREKLCSSPAEQQNRTMLIQVGDNELLLISLDRKSVIFERQFKDISFCSQVLFRVFKTLWRVI
jgi:hypothetical protein